MRCLFLVSKQKANDSKTLTTSGTEQDTTSPFGAACALDQLRLVGGESDLHGDGSSLVLGQRRSSCAWVHDTHLSRATESLSNPLDPSTFKGHNKDMNTSRIVRPSQRRCQESEDLHSAVIFARVCEPTAVARRQAAVIAHESDCIVCATHEALSS